MAVRFTLTYSIMVDFSVDELWPDGDAPENPTADDVEGLIDSCGGWPRIISDWNLNEDATWSVEVVE